VFTGVQDAHERRDHCLLADDGQDLFTDTSMVFANVRHVRVVVGERERVKVNKYGEKCRRAGASFQPHVQDHCQDHQEACYAGGSQDGLRPYVSAQEVARTSMQKLSIKVWVLNANLVKAHAFRGSDLVWIRGPHEVCPRNTGALVRHAVVVR
jgi:hypothetical protein